MKNILHITASIRAEESVSRSLSRRLVDGLVARSGATVTHRDLSANDLPFLDGERHAANYVPALERTPAQQELAAIGDTLIEELQAADIIVLGVPIYNFSPPATVKAWADLVARAGTTFRFSSDGPEGMLSGKKAYLVVASGGTPVGSEIDFMSPWLVHFLGFIGISDVEIATAEGIMGDRGDEAIAKANEAIDRILA